MIALHRIIRSRKLFYTSCLIGVGTMVAVAQASAQEVTIGNSHWQAKFKQAGLVEMTDNQGQKLVEPGLTTAAATLFVGGKKFTAKTSGTTSDHEITSSQFPGLVGAESSLSVSQDAESGDLIVTQAAQCPGGKLESAEWTIGYIPLDYNVIIPGGGGEIMTKDSPYKSRNFNYLMGWDAQLLVFEGKGRGFYLWCDDAHEKQKAIAINRTEKGWVITCRSTNDAPFEKETTLRSQNWRINTYTGDWRVPAKRYREWAQKVWNVPLLSERSPSWMKDIRLFVFIEQLEPSLLDELAKQFDPAQTVVYLNHWRKQQFDRENPSYTDPNEKLKPMMDRAHELGFKVILHTNFWGVSPDNPVMAEVAQYQVVGQDGKKLRYENLKQNPPLYLNYINPASKRWREIYVEKIKEMVKITGADGVHLDQDFHSHNDMNGLIDGLTFNEGLLALHAELKEALPQIAISGEGLNEMTYRTVDFAQRHVWSAMAGTIDRAALSVGHPISSYLFAPYLRLYGWLGFPTPQENPQMYAAWREDYKDWGIFPTLRYFREISPEALRDPNGFYRQVRDEAQFFQQNHAEPDLEGTWAETTAFPFKSTAGDPLLWTKDRRMIKGDKEISRTVTGQTTLDLRGTIRGSLFFDEKHIFGLDPDTFYPYFDAPRDLSQPHIEHLTEGLDPGRARRTDNFLFFSTTRAEKVLIDLVKELPTAQCTVRLDNGQTFTEQGSVNGNHSAILIGAGSTLALSPPSEKPASTDLESTAVVPAKGLGEIVATYHLTLPANGPASFQSNVGMDGRAVRTTKTDGMKFTVKATGTGESLESSAMATDDSQVPLDLDLAKLAGQEIVLELIADSGPAHNATEDRGIWYRPHLVQLVPLGSDPIRVAGIPSDWGTVAAADGLLKYTRDKEVVSVPPHQGMIVVSRLPFGPAGEGTRLGSFPKTLTTSDLWDNPLVKGQPQPTLGENGDDLTVFLPVRAKLRIDWLLTLPAGKRYFQTDLANPQEPGFAGGVKAKLAVNDRIIAEAALPPKGKAALRANLAEWAGQNVILSLILEGKDYRGDSKVVIVQPTLVNSLAIDTLLHWNFEKQETGKPIASAAPLSDAVTKSSLDALESPPIVEAEAPPSSASALTKSANFSEKQFMRSKGLGKALIIPMRSGLTLEAWINPATTGKSGTSYICSNRDPGRNGTGYTLAINRKGELFSPSFAVTSGGKTVSVTSSEAYKAGEWHHLAGLRQEDGSLSLFVDGKEVATSGVKTEPGAIDSYVNLTVGRSPHTSAPDSFFQGRIAEIRLSSGALPPGQLLRGK